MYGKEILKPCPFCGGRAYFDRDEHGWQWIECEKCHVATSQRASLMEDCKPLLAEAWNTRAALSIIDPETIRAEARAEALREAADRYCKNVCAWPSTEWEHPDECECSQRATILADEPKEREADRPQVGDEDFHRQMLLAFQEIRRKRRDEGMSEWADGDMAAWVMDRLPALRSHQAEEIKLRAEVERRVKEAEV